jgi:hypothetical protein
MPVMSGKAGMLRGQLFGSVLMFLMILICRQMNEVILLKIKRLFEPTQSSFKNLININPP